MVCSFPPPLTDDQLTAALDGEADTSLQNHVAGCAFCGARLEHPRAAEGALRHPLRRWDCPEPQRLGDYMLALLSQADERVVMRHLEQCVLCAAELAELRSFLAEDAPVAVPAAPTQQRDPSAPRWRERLARLMPRTPALALRGAGSGPLMAEVDGVTIVLDVQPAAAGLADVLGQVVADEQDSWTGALVELRVGGRLQTVTEVDDLGGFSYSGVPLGAAELRVTAPAGQSVLVRDVELGA